MMLKERYQKEIAVALQHDLQEENVLAVPRVRKVVLNVGTGKQQREPKFQEGVMDSLTRITGQRPVATLSRTSIAAFKLREGAPVGVMVTLRGQRMWDFLEKLVRVSLPRVRDFRGLSPRTVDEFGNLSIGFREHVVFPEIRSDEVELVHGMQVTVVSSAGSHARGMALFRALGLPFRQMDPPAKRVRRTRERKAATA